MSQTTPVPLLDVTRNSDDYTQELLATCERVLTSGRFILGDEVTSFENEIAAQIGTQHAIGVSSGTDALLLALMALGIGEGDEVICPTFTFFATAGSIWRVGAKPVFVESVEGIEGEGSGGYATEMSDEYKAAQAELVSSHIAKQDIVITTALIPGRPAPRLISDAQVASMKPGSVIFDLAVAQGGNVEGSRPDEVVEKHGVKIVGYSNTAGHLAADASALFARNLYNFLSAFWDEEAGRPVLDEEIGDAVRLTQGGKVVNERLTPA